MKDKDVLIAHPSNANELGIIKAFFQALSIKFEIAPKSPYDSKFEAKILQGDKDLKAGKGRKVTVKELNNLWK